MTNVPEVDEDRLRRGLRALTTMDPPPLDNARVAGTGWVGSFVVGIATVVLLAGVLTTTLVLRNRDTGGAAPAARASSTTTPAPSFSPQPTPSVMPTPTPSPMPTATPSPTPLATSAVAYLPPIGPQCLASQLEVRVGDGLSNLSNAVLYLIFTDRGPARCTLQGTPIVQLLDNRGRTLTSPPLQDTPSGYIPALPNNGVGLLPLQSEGVAPGPSPEGGIRGQAALPLQYFADGCNATIAAIRIRIGGGTFTIPLTFSGSAPGCQTTTIFVNPFQPAEYAR